ncbi:MAG: hypothetical protein H7Z40_21420 [Phycisphaerae bacterium]|nr:hypothetical protein [Gemmatimonadaceae bacterium]
MLDSVRARNRSAVVFLISLAVFVPALLIPRSGDDHSVRIMILTFSFAVMLFSAVWLLVRGDEARRLIRLRAGQGILARWTIDAARWEWFRRHSQEWDKQKGLHPNDADFTQIPGDAGIEVVVSRDGILIGADFHPLEIDVRITVRADWMEFNQVIPKPNGPAFRVVLRLPLQPGWEHLAAEVSQAYQRVTDARKSDRRPLIYIALFCFVGLPAVTGLVWLILKVTGWVE